MTRSGKNIGLYLPGEVYGYIADDARVRGIPVTTWVRDAVLAACPADVRPEQAGAKLPAKRRRPAQKARQQAKKPARKAAPQKQPRDKPALPGDGKQEPVSFDALVERNRDRVLDLDARGHLPNAICSITRLEYRVVRHILTTRKKPAKGRP